jgi:hypothetical protein
VLSLQVAVLSICATFAGAGRTRGGPRTDAVAAAGQSTPSATALSAPPYPVMLNQSMQSLFDERMEALRKLQEELRAGGPAVPGGVSVKGEL